MCVCVLHTSYFDIYTSRKLKINGLKLPNFNFYNKLIFRMNPLGKSKVDNLTTTQETQLCNYRKSQYKLLQISKPISNSNHFTCMLPQFRIRAVDLNEKSHSWFFLDRSWGWCLLSQLCPQKLGIYLIFWYLYLCPDKVRFKECLEIRPGILWSSFSLTRRLRSVSGLTLSLVVMLIVSVLVSRNFRLRHFQGPPLLLSLSLYNRCKRMRLLETVF